MVREKSKWSNEQPYAGTDEAILQTNTSLSNGVNKSEIPISKFKKRLSFEFGILVIGYCLEIRIWNLPTLSSYILAGHTVVNCKVAPLRVPCKCLVVTI